MKKRWQFILVGSLLLPCSTGMLLASNAHCRSWVAQAATQTTDTVVATRRHYSRKVLAGWAVWRAAHPNAKPVRAKPVPRPFVSPDMLDLFCDVSAATVDEAITTIMEPIENATAPDTPEIAVDSMDSPGLFTLIADDPTTPDTSEPPVFDTPTGFGPPLTSGIAPVSGLPPVGTPPSGDPPTTGSSAPPPPVAVAAEPSSLLLLGTGIVAAAGLFRRRKLQS